MNIIGLSETHTATACLARNGVVVACASEERFTRKKGQSGFPKRALNYCLEQMKGQKIDKVIFSGRHWDPIVKTTLRASDYSVQDHVRMQYELFYPLLIEREDRRRVAADYFLKELKEKGNPDANYLWGDFSYSFDLEKDAIAFQNIRRETICSNTGVSENDVIFCDHHTAHAYYAYFASPFRQQPCIIITMDGWGDESNATVFIARDDQLSEYYRTDQCNIGRLWRYITLLLGMKPEEHEYKVMGLAPYANEKIKDAVYRIFKNYITVDGLDFKYIKKGEDIYFYFKKLLEGYRFDGIAGALQQYTEEIITQWVANIIKQTGIKRIVFSGGTAMNIKACMSIAGLPEVKEFYVAASGGDESTAIGVVYSFFENRSRPLTDIYLGPDFGEKEIKDALSDWTAIEDYEIARNFTPNDIAELLFNNKTVARCSGKMEFGARALGNRSILANPAKTEMIGNINSQIKFRDFWMPFTPTILAERVSDYVINPKDLSCPHMTMAFDMTDIGKKHFAAAIHPYDKTVRPQILEKNQNREYYDILKAFEKISGIGGVLNTSFNLHGEPIVCSPKDAIHTLENSGLDALVLNNHLILKKTAS